MVDTQNPTITCPADVLNVPADAGQCYATGVALGSPTTADNCGVATVTNNAPVQFPCRSTTATSDRNRYPWQHSYPQPDGHHIDTQ
ncbi:MAG: hypothetical protein R2756_13030 [Bacteroidales bacterium]